MTELVEHSAHLTALGAEGFDLDGGVFKAKPEGTRLFPKRAIQNRIVDLGHSPAHTAYQELTAVIIFRAIATQERIQRVQTMHESGFLKELQGPVNRRRGGLRRGRMCALSRRVAARAALDSNTSKTRNCSFCLRSRVSTAS